jgi:hypothetical protein
MKYLMILLLAFVMSFSAIGSSMLADGDLPVTQSVEISIDVSESCDAEEPNPSDESKHYVIGTQYTDDDILSSFQRVSFHYSNEEKLALNKPPQH